MLDTIKIDLKLGHQPFGDRMIFPDGKSEEYRTRKTVAGRYRWASEILRMPMQYKTWVGDNGSALSGGQRQRIMLARALYKEPAILFLDEATSHLDFASEERINTAIRGLRISRVVVTHRRETLLMADRVLHLGPSGRFLTQNEHEVRIASSMVTGQSHLASLN